METIVEKAARIIAPEAFENVTWHDATGKPLELDSLEKARREYHKSQAICRAIDILRLATRTPQLKRLLVKYETDCWERLGIPRDVLNTQEVQETIADKF